MSFINTISLKGLTTREAITDALYRATWALDEKDLLSLESALTSDVEFSIDDYTVAGFDKLKSMTLDSPMRTTHYVTCVRIDVDGDSATTARLTANTLAYHYTSETEGKNFLRAAKHDLGLVKNGNDGFWKIQKWRGKTTRSEGDISVFQSASS